MHLLNCIFLVITIATAVYANCHLQSAYNDEICNSCTFENLHNITERVIPANSCVHLTYENCHFGRFHKGLVNQALQVYELWMINSVEFIEDGAFDDYKETHMIFFKKNNISLLPDFAFRGLSNLKDVNFIKNQIVKIGENVFTGASSITELNLSHNRIESFCIKQLVNLKRVNLEYNLITVLSEIPKSLNKAEFAFNQLTKITNVTFRNMKSLKYLELGWNNITEIESGAFYGAKKLQYVNLWCNNLTIVSNVTDSIDDQEMKSSNKRFELNLQQNKIASFSPENLNIYDASVSIDLDLSQISIEQLDKSKFNVTSNIHTLDLSRNKIKTVPIGFFHNQYHENRMHYLVLSKNAITELEVGSFLGLSSLKYLDLRHNRIETLNETIFFDTPNLSVLKFSHNLIRHLNAPAIVGLTRLITIEMCPNKFSDPTYVFKQFTNNNVRVVPICDNINDCGNSELY